MLSPGGGKGGGIFRELLSSTSDIELFLMIPPFET